MQLRMIYLERCAGLVNYLSHFVNNNLPRFFFLIYTKGKIGSERHEQIRLRRRRWLLEELQHTRYERTLFENAYSTQQKRLVSV